MGSAMGKISGLGWKIGLGRDRNESLRFRLERIGHDRCRHIAVQQLAPQTRLRIVGCFQPDFRGQDLHGKNRQRGEETQHRKHGGKGVRLIVIRIIIGGVEGRLTRSNARGLQRCGRRCKLHRGLRQARSGRRTRGFQRNRRSRGRTHGRSTRDFQRNRRSRGRTRRGGRRFRSPGQTGRHRRRGRSSRCHGSHRRGRRTGSIRGLQGHTDGFLLERHTGGLLGRLVFGLVHAKRCWVGTGWAGLNPHLQSVLQRWFPE